MRAIFDFIFNNILLVIVILLAYYVYRQYKELKAKEGTIKEVFTKTLDKYLDKKFAEAKKIADSVMEEYGHVELIKQEVERIEFTIEKSNNGSINDKVQVSNLLNKFKVNKKIDLERYPNVKNLENIGTFTDEDMGSIDNGVAIARKEYNARAFRYNEKANDFPMQYLTKLFKLPATFTIFDAPKTTNYEEKYEVFEEKEPEINTLDTLNRTDTSNVTEEAPKTEEKKDEVVIDHSSVVLKPTVSLEEKKEQE
jgi:hypothetical protein